MNLETFKSTRDRANFPLSLRFNSFGGHSDDPDVTESPVVEYWWKSNRRQREELIGFLCQLNYLGCYFPAYRYLDELNQCIGQNATDLVNQADAVLDQIYASSREPLPRWRRNAAFLLDVRRLGVSLETMNYTRLRDDSPQMLRAVKYLETFLAKAQQDQRRHELIMAATYTFESRISNALTRHRELTAM